MISFAAAILTCLFFSDCIIPEAVDIQPNVSVSGLISPEPPSYILGEYQGKLAVYRRDESEPFMVFQVYLHNLPEQDQEILAQGLEVRDYRSWTANRRLHQLKPRKDKGQASRFPLLAWPLSCFPKLQNRSRLFNCRISAPINRSVS